MFVFGNGLAPLPNLHTSPFPLPTLSSPPPFSPLPYSPFFSSLSSLFFLCLLITNYLTRQVYALPSPHITHFKAPWFIFIYRAYTIIRIKKDGGYSVLSVSSNITTSFKSKASIISCASSDELKSIAGPGSNVASKVSTS